MKELINIVKTGCELAVVLLFCAIILTACGKTDAEQSGLEQDVVVEKEAIAEKEDDSEPEIIRDQNEDISGNTDEDVLNNLRASEDIESVQEDVKYVEMYTMHKVWNKN